MKKKLLQIAIIFILIISAACLIGCDSTGGRSDRVTIPTFRNDRQFEFPVRVSKATMEPSSTKYFKSKQSLTQICDGINAGGNYVATERDGYLLIYKQAYGYCVIAPTEKGTYNYFITNMALDFHPSDQKYSFLPVPMYMISIPLDASAIIPGAEYAFSGSKEDLVDFYREYGYRIAETDNGMVISDPIGRFYGDIVSFDDVVESFEIKISGNKLAYYPHIHEGA